MAQSQRPQLEQSAHPQPSLPHSTYGKPMPLKLHRKVFLSHSGKDKEFVRHLHKALRSSYRGSKVDFFDEDSIPKGEAVDIMNIVEEARTSELGVLVLTDDFFTCTKCPMLELEAFVAEDVKLLPLFLTMSVEEFKAKEQRERWVKKWREWSVVDDKLERWGHALSLVSKFSGLEFCKMATNQSDYIDKVVKEVTRIIGPDIPWSQGVIQGGDRLYKMVDDMYKKAASNRDSSVQNMSNYTQAVSTSDGNSSLKDVTSDLVGIHGFAGLGKTTLGKLLCDYYYRELRGRVCYIDVGSSRASPEQNSTRRLISVRSSLNPGNNAYDSHQLQLRESDQHQYLLRKELSSMEDPVFLVIDNIQSEESQEEADWYLDCEFPPGSKIFLTSRSEDILANLCCQYKNISFSVVTASMPPLTLEEARGIFVQELPELRKLGLTSEQEDVVNECVNMCTILNKRYHEDVVNECVNMCTIHNKQYHPLMLKSLAAFVKLRGRSSRNLDWKERLAQVRSKGIDNIKDDVWNKVFSVFEMTYELLSGETRKVFLDWAIATHAFKYSYGTYKWIKMVHSDLGQKTLEKIILQLEDVCFIEREPCCLVPDLLVDFGKYIARGEGNYVVVDASTPWQDQLPRSARHISICKASATQLDLRSLDGVEVLHLVENAELQEVRLSPTTCADLRSLVVTVPDGTTLCWTLDEDCSPPRCGGLFLKWMQIGGNVSFRRTRASGLLSQIRGLLTGSSDTDFHSLRKLELSKSANPVSILGCLRNLEVLLLRHLPNVQSIDLTTCANLKTVNLSSMPSLKFIRGLEGNLQHRPHVDIWSCEKLSTLTIPANSVGQYHIGGCPSLETLSLAAGSRAECPRVDRFSYRGRSGIFIHHCPSFPRVVGFAHYTDCMTYSAGLTKDNHLAAGVTLEDFFGRLAIKDAGVDFSLCKAKVTKFDVDGYYNQAGLAGVSDIHLEDAQHVGFLISALFMAQPDHLTSLGIVCKRGGECGCDQNAPYFITLPFSEYKYGGRQTYPPEPCLAYSCPQVRDLESLARWHVLEKLDLNGCTSVEVWPNFAAMTSLRSLNLSNTSLKKWPAAVLLLPKLMELDLSGCRELPAKELIKNGAIAVPESMMFVPPTCRRYSASLSQDLRRKGTRVLLRTYYLVYGYSLASLRKDLREGTRDRGSVADALDALSPQLVVLFDQWSSSIPLDTLIVQLLVVEIMYLVWFGGIDEEEEEENFTEEERQYITTKMRGLLCSESFLSLPFRSCNELSLSALAGKWVLRRGFMSLYRWYKLINLDPRGYHETDEKLKVQGLAGIVVMGIALVGGAVSFGVSLDKNCVLNLLQSPVKERLFNRICPCSNPSGRGVEKCRLRWGKMSHNLRVHVREAEDAMQRFI